MERRKKVSGKKGVTELRGSREIQTKTPEETKKVGARLAGKIKKFPSLILLNGDLGAGKTQFAQGFIQGLLKNKVPVLSPTYSIVNAYKFGKKSIYHVDLYRVSGAEDLESVGFWDFFEGPNLILVEWAERLPHLWPTGVSIVTLDFEIVSETQRKISVTES